MNNYLQHQYRETKSKFDKFSSRLEKSQEKGEFQRMSKQKQNFLINRLRKLWERLRILEVQLKLTTVGAALACMMIVSSLNAQEQFVSAPEKNPLPPPTIFGLEPFLVDIDQDGDLDLLAGENFDGFTLFENTGTVSSPNFERVPEAENPFSGLSNPAVFKIWDIIDAGDLDGDGDMDFLSRDEYIIKNIGSNSDLNYKEETIVGGLPNYWYKGSLGDIDEDGDLDLVIFRNYAGNVDYINVYENIGNKQNFVLDHDSIDVYEIPWGDEIHNVENLRILDLDGDDDLDLLLGTAHRDQSSYGKRTMSIKVVENSGTAKVPMFVLKEDVDNPYKIIESDEFSPGDLDGDGDFDVVMSDYYSGGIHYFELNGDTVIENKEIIPQFYDGIVLQGSWWGPTFTDFNNDGDFDIFSGCDWDNIHYYEYEETGIQLKYSLVNDKPLAFLDETVREQFPFCVDLDHDGDTDILLYTFYNFNNLEYTEYRLLKNTGNDTDPVYKKIPSALDSLKGFLYPSFIDIDGDNDDDLVFLYWDGTVYYENTGSDPFEFTKVTDQNNNPLGNIAIDSYDFGYGSLVFSDVDSDGDFDIAMAGYYEMIYYFENIGTPEQAQFIDKSSEGPFSQIPSGYGCLNMVDIDNDGDDDLFVHELYGMITKFYENTGGQGSGVEVENMKTLEIYPNPVVDELNIRMNDESGGPQHYEIVNMEGRQVISGTIEKSGEVHENKINTASLNPGLYVIMATSADQVYVSKFIKE